MSLTILAYRFVTQPELYGFYVAKKKDIEWMVERCGPYAAVHLTDDDDPANRVVMKAICRYIERYKKMPPSFGGVRAYVSENPEFRKEYIQGDDDGGQIHRVEDILKLLGELEEWEVPENPRSRMEIEILFDAVFKEVHGCWLKYVHDRSARIANGELVNINGEGVAGPAAAEQWFRMAIQQDFKDEVAQIKGLLSENVQAIRDLIKSNASGEGPLTTGYSFIDEVISNKDRFIGIMGKGGEGKTTFLYNLLYNLLLSGKSILLIALEDDAETVYRKIACLHALHSDYVNRFTLPPWNAWERNKVTDQDRAHLEEVLNDIAASRNILGLLDVQNFREWEEIAGYLEANRAKYNYDILSLDYLTRLSPPPGTRAGDRTNYFNGLIDEVQNYTRDHKITVFTPVPVNREGMKSAQAQKELGRKSKEEQLCSHYRMEHINQYSRFDYDLDLCLSCFSDDEMKLGRKIEIGCVKHRQGPKFKARNLDIDPLTGAITEGVDYAALWELTMDDTEGCLDGSDYLR